VTYLHINGRVYTQIETCIHTPMCRTYIQDANDLDIEKRPIYIEKRPIYIEKRPIYMDTDIHINRRVCTLKQMYTHMQTGGVYTLGVKDLYLWKKRLIYIQTDVYLYGNKHVFTWKSMYVYIEIDVCLHGNRSVFIWKWMCVYMEIYVYRYTDAERMHIAVLDKGI